MSENHRGRYGRVQALLGASLIVLAAGGTAGAATLNEAIATAVANNPRIGVVANNREATEQELRQARAQYLPSINVGYGIGIDKENDFPARARGGPDWLWANDAFARLNQRIFDGFETDSLVAREMARTQSTANRVFENAEFLGLDVVGVYVEIALRRYQVGLAEGQVGIHQEIFDAVQQLLTQGTGNIADVSQAAGRLARALATLEQERNFLRDAEALYERLVGVYPDNIDEVLPPLEVLPTDPDASLNQLVTDNPTVAIFDAEIDAADADIDVARSHYFPDVNLVAEHNHFEDTTGLRTYSENSSVMLRITWEFFAGGANRARHREALWRAAQARSDRDERLIFAREDLRDSWHALEAAQARVINFEEAVVRNTETRDAYRQQFTVGQRTLLDVLDAENELFVTEGQLATEKTNVVRAGYRILASLGQLLATVGVEAPETATRAPENFSASVEHIWAEDRAPVLE